VLAGADLFGEPGDGANFIITVFAVVVIGGMGSFLGSVVTGFGLASSRA
jgi:branched-chain amino acid transport system permease protein